MALSDYLTSKEWDACFYASTVKHKMPNFGESMHRTIQELLATGYVFTGLDENGNKKVQIQGTGNASKVMIFFGNPDGCDIMSVLDSGRSFLKERCMKLIAETDEEWAKLMEEVKKEQDETTNTV